MLAMTMGLPWMPICFQVIISMISTIVPKPPGKRDERVGEVEQEPARARASCRRPSARSSPRCADFAALEGLGDDAGDLPAGAEDLVGDRAHQSAGGAAVDQPDAALGDLAAERADLGLDGRFLFGLDPQ